MPNAPYYTQNESYTHILKQIDGSYYHKYIDLMSKFSSPGARILDVGCGAGQVISALSARDRTSVGLDISQTSVESSMSQGLDARLYDGTVFPFEDSSFEMIGCCNVIEHVDDVELFLSEMDRTLKKEGHLCIICPNFLSVTNNYHHHTQGVIQKIKNGFSMVTKIATPGYSWDKMEVIHREVFQNDDDACNVMNPIDINAWFRSKGYRVTYRSCQSQYEGAGKYFDLPVLRSLFGSLCIVAQKV